MADKTFVDTNILVYAHDSQAGTKQTLAAEQVQDLWIQRTGVLSLQVLQEFYVTLTQKIPHPLPSKTVMSLVEHYGYWEQVALRVEDLLEAIKIQQKHRISFWDSLIVRAALQGGCAILLSEDLKHGQKIGDLIVRNPFRS